MTSKVVKEPSQLSEKALRQIFLSLGLGCESPFTF